jgi:hypothetical protein
LTCDDVVELMVSGSKGYISTVGVGGMRASLAVATVDAAE